MEGYRVTEEGNLRTTESSDTRVTEGFIEGFADLSATGSISVVGLLKAPANASLVTQGSVLLVGEAVLFGRADFTGVGSATVDSDLKASGAYVGDATGTISSSGVRIQPGATSLSGEGSIASKAGFKFVGASDIQAEGIFSSTPKFTAQGLFGPFDVDVERITESGDVRVTEDGNVRIVDFYQPNAATGSLISEPSVVLFVSEPYAKYLSNWQRAVPYVKYEGEWVIPQKAYKHLSGRWKRIY